MIAILRKNLGFFILKHNSSPPCKSHASLSLLLHDFSTSSEAFATTTVYDVLVSKHHFSPELASAVASDLNRFRSPEKADSILTFLEENCFSTTQLQNIVRYEPRILTAKLEDDIKLKINTFKDFGFSPLDIAKITTSNQAILHSSTVKKIIPQLSALKGLLGSSNEVVGLVKRDSWFMTRNLEKTLVPNLQVLKRNGVAVESIRVLLLHFPRCLLVRQDVMQMAVEKAKMMGFNRRSKNFVYAVHSLALLNEEKWELKFQGFRDMGFSESDILSMLRRSPMLFCASLEKVKEIMNLLLATRRFDISDMVNDPLTLRFSIEKRYKPRLRILEILESKKLIKKWPSLSEICRLSQNEFSGRFIRPYSDHLGDVCVVTEDCLKNKDGKRSKK